MEEATRKTGPLTGFTVIEMAGLGPVPHAGLMLADRYGAEILRPWPVADGNRLHASRRKEITLRFAAAAATRLQRLLDPEAGL